MRKSGIGRLLTTGIAICTAAALTACGLLPKEEEPHKVNIVKKDISEEYSLAMAELHDVSFVAQIDCTYSQLKEEKLSFKSGDRRVAYIYFNKGDEVKAGDLVAQLDISDLESEILRMSLEIEELELKSEQASEMVDFYNSMLNSSSVSLIDYENYSLSCEEYNEKLKEYANTIQYNREVIEKDTIEVENCRMYAGMDGIVSNIRDNLLGMSVKANTSYITIVDSSVCAFQAMDKEKVGYVKVGDMVDIELNNSSYPAKVTAADPENGKMTFELTDMDFTPSVGTRGSISILVDEVKQVLALPVMAVYSTDEFYYVYTLNDDGVRELVKVDIGLYGNSYVEIKSGVELYESVILH